MAIHDDNNVLPAACSSDSDCSSLTSGDGSTSSDRASASEAKGAGREGELYAYRATPETLPSHLPHNSILSETQSCSTIAHPATIYWPTSRPGDEAKMVRYQPETWNAHHPRRAREVATGAPGPHHARQSASC